MTDIRPGDFIRAEGTVSAIRCDGDGTKWIEVRKATITEHRPKRPVVHWYTMPTSATYVLELVS